MVNGLLSKILDEIEVVVSGITTFDSDEHRANTFASLMVVILLGMVPFHTEIKIYALSQAQSEDAIEYWSDAILAQNKTIALAYEGKAAVAASHNEYDQMSANMEKMLLNSPYDITKYQEYLQALEKAMNFYNARGDLESLEKYARIALDIPDRLNEVKQKTSKLAYQIDDKPNLELTENEQLYLLNLEEVVDRIKKEDATPAN